jgi:hypothetical protein
MVVEAVSALDRIAILQELDRQAQLPGRPAVKADVLASTLELELPYVKEQLEILMVTDRVELRASSAGVEARITPFGRQSLNRLGRRRALQPAPPKP